ncbi:DEDD exonuclease domain-containing protein [soil metagenome]
MFQPSLSALGQPLADSTFVVVDLETTGGSPTTDRITEIGAVKIRGGEVVGELSTLVDPGIAIPGAITVLTGISRQLVEGRPGIETVLPSFLEFSRGAALVAHNARFDTGFLNAALQRLDYPRLDHRVVCTAQLARRLVGDEVANRKLDTLARHFRSSTVPIHRALADARATVDVFHGLLEQAGTFGVVTLEDLVAFACVRNMPLFTSRRKMADDLPSLPGVYQFVSASGEVLYVGKATDLRTRVRQYFGTDTRRRIRALVTEAARVEHTVTPTAVHAEILESRLIRSHRPRFNSAGKRVRTPVWITLTAGPYPRLSVTRRAPRGDRLAIGPLPSGQVAQQIIDAVHDAFPLRRCSTAMKADTRFAPCALADMGRCVAPCHGAASPDQYAAVTQDVAGTLDGDLGPALQVLDARMRARAAAGRYEEASDVRDRMATLLTWITRTRRDQALRCAGVVAASRPVRGRREVLVQQGGWLIGTAVVDQAAEVAAAIDAIRQGAGPPDDAAPPPEEMRILQRWLGAVGVRAEVVEGPLAWPIDGGAVTEAQRRSIARSTADRGRPAVHLAAKRLTRSVAPTAVGPG